MRRVLSPLLRRPLLLSCLCLMTVIHLARACGLSFLWNGEAATWLSAMPAGQEVRLCGRVEDITPMGNTCQLILDRTVCLSQHPLLSQKTDQSPYPDILTSEFDKKIYFNKKSYFKKSYFKKSYFNAISHKSYFSQESHLNKESYFDEGADGESQGGGSFPGIFPGKVAAYVSAPCDIPIGAYVILEGEPGPIKGPENPGEADMRHYYACRHIYSELDKARVVSQSRNYSAIAEGMRRLRDYLAEVFDACAGEDAGIFSAVLLGQRSTLSKDTRQLYQMAGIVHILSISGLHISILGMGLLKLLRKAGCPRGAANLMASVFVVFYGLFTGGRVSAVRACLMFLIALQADVLGRTYDLLSAASLAAILILLESPEYLWDSGFLLSFGAIAGVGALNPALNRLLKDEPLRRKKACQPVIASLSVQLFLLPIQMTAYGQVSLAGLALNLLVLPTSAGLLLSALGTAALGSWLIPAGKIAALPGRWLLAVYAFLGRVSLYLPFGNLITGEPSKVQVILYYSLLAALAVYLRTEKKSRRLQGRKLSAVLPAFFLLLTAVIFYRPQKAFSVTCLSVGQGDCALITVPGGGAFLVDGGSTSKKNVGSNRILPYCYNQGISHLDAIFVSHTDMDHINGILELLQMIEKRLTSLRADYLILPAWSDPPAAYEDLVSAAVSAGIKVLAAQKGDGFTCQEATFTVLSPGDGAAGHDPNEDGLVFLLSYGPFKGLFTGDIGEATEKKLLPLLPDITFLKVAHHGSRTSTCNAFLDTASPEICVISVQENSLYGHPHKETLHRLTSHNITPYLTSRDGAITITMQNNMDLQVTSYLSGR